MNLYRRFAFLLAISSAACGLPQEGDIGQFQVALVRNNTVFRVTQVFQLHVFRAVTRSGASVTCSDIPTNFRPGDELLLEVPDSPRSIPWKQKTTEATIQNVVVPPDEKLVIVALALAQWGIKGVHTVGTACQDNLSFSAGTSQTVPLTMRPTSGAVCLQTSECWAGLSCEKSFPGGYCLKLGCAGDQDCPPGSRCISDETAGNVCLATCEGISDCNTAPPQTQVCEGRFGPTSGGCGNSCVYPLWKVGNKCPI